MHKMSVCTDFAIPQMSCILFVGIAFVCWLVLVKALSLKKRVNTQSICIRKFVNKIVQTFSYIQCIRNALKSMHRFRFPVEFHIGNVRAGRFPVCACNPIFKWLGWHCLGMSIWLYHIENNTIRLVQHKHALESILVE